MTVMQYSDTTKPMEIISILETQRYIVQFLKIFIPTPRKVNGISKGEGVSKAQFLKGNMMLKWSSN